MPSVESLVEAQNQYMLRIEESERMLDEDVVRHLNMTELFAVAGRVLGSECYRADKIYQGGFNQIFNLTFRDQKILAIARINMPHGGGVNFPEQERRDRVASEVATLKWLKINTEIPVPTVYAYDSNPNNVVGAAFMIQERMIGHPLSDIWDNLGVKDRTMIIQQLARYQRELYNTSFDQLGSLYEDENGTGFRIGRWAPAVRAERPLINRGPWATSREQISSFLSEQIMDMNTNAEKIYAERKRETKPDEGDSGSSIDEFRDLYDALLHFVDNVELLDICHPSFSLTHPDYSLRNILVGYHDPTHVVGMIDWEGTRIQPWWNTTVMAEFMWDEMGSSTLPAGGTDAEGTWDDVVDEWNAILYNDPLPSPDFNSTKGPILSIISSLAEFHWVTWATMKYLVGEIVELRFKWPQKDDPAFVKLDEIIRRYRPESFIGEALK